MGSAWISIKGISYSSQVKLHFKLIWTFVLLTKLFPHFMIRNFLNCINTIHCLVKGNLNKLKQMKCSWICKQSDKPFMSQDSLMIVYNAFVHSDMNCGLIYGRNSSRSANIFKIQNSMFIIITGSIIRDLCRELFTSASAFTTCTTLSYLWLTAKII
jgi:hypothetical protein